MIKRPETPNKNKLYFLILATGLFSLIIYNLFSLQIVKGSQYYYDSKNSFSAYSTVRASRGLIYDRNGIKLVDNELKYNLYIIHDNQRPTVYASLLEKTLSNLNKVFNEKVDEKYAKQSEILKSFPDISEIKLYSRIDYNPYVFQIEANPDNFPLVKIEKTNVRKYLYPELFSHIIGYTGEIDEENYRTGKYNYGDEIGKFGLERGYDAFLRGKNGLEQVNVSSNSSSGSSRTTSIINQKENGQDIYLSIDLNYQKKLYEVTKLAFEKEALNNATSSSTVIQDVKTGDILAMASYPTFDANLFVNGISQNDYKKYIEDPGKPLSNKAIQFSQPPGSIVKTLVDAVAMDKGAIDKNTIFSTGGTFLYGGVPFQDVGKRDFGNVDAVQALCMSSNIFHMKTALKLDEVTKGKSADTINDLFTKIGLNQPSNLNLGSEAYGYFPTPKDKEAKGETWLPGYLLNASIGQGEVKLNALGASNLANFLANKGVYRKPSIIKRTAEPEIYNSGIKASNFDTINEGMRCAAKRDNPVTKYDITKYPEVSEKTGTAETGQKKNGEDVLHGWEISFSPSVNPEISMGIFIENGTHGFHSGYISREFYKSWSTELRK